MQLQRQWSIAPRDGYALVTPSLDANVGLAATACSLKHALRYSALLDSFALVTQSADDSADFVSSNMLIGACTCRYSALRDSYARVTPITIS